MRMGNQLIYGLNLKLTRYPEYSSSQYPLQGCWYCGKKENAKIYFPLLIIIFFSQLAPQLNFLLAVDSFQNQSFFDFDSFFQPLILNVFVSSFNCFFFWKIIFEKGYSNASIFIRREPVQVCSCFRDGTVPSL